MRIIIGASIEILTLFFSRIHDLHIVFVIVAEECNLRTRLFVEILFNGDIHIERLLRLELGIAFEQPSVADRR